mmetsp:Transcript_136/g.162  ORF Transcript_136/g.162 Transcript_136/m.162 type:complete len:369 (+) Transcript_136:152-1258(+)|eukprot:CAMPEP_0119053056 /NCGR_PEP_ID=MMETSP1177-20130426/74160_1 /TAXON_ID=2985 /ORGANISM="Ochromonas sp, Strain CCMP1899" /LENGTH=368 /DNA_ID=CAMNT_0007032857 /DNA_START=136 /DNA_END=1242 /DNA_ORIENTATION=-
MITTEQIFGAYTDTLHLRSDQFLGLSEPNVKTKSLHIFFFPGNPGTLYFYINFLERLLNGIRDSDYFAEYEYIYCHGTGNANHHLEGSSTSTVQSETTCDDVESYGLEYQIRHKLAFIKSVIDPLRAQDVDNTEIMMIGHSIGAYMAIDALQRCEYFMQRTKHVLLLMPFISWSKLPKVHRTKLSLFSYFHPRSHHLVTFLMGPLLRMNPGLRRNILGTVTSLKGKILSIVSDGLINRRILDNFLVMGYDEIRDVKKNQLNTISLLEELDRGKRCGEKEILMLYTDNDDWASLKDAKIFEERLKCNTTITVEPGLTHGFSLTDARIEKTCLVITDYFSSKKDLKASSKDVSHKVLFTDGGPRSIKSRL